MIIWLILAVLCFYLFRRFIISIEYRQNGYWVNCTLPIWAWILVVLACCTPIINLIGLTVFEGIIIGDSRSNWADFRIKEGKTIYFAKIIDLLNKEF